MIEFVKLSDPNVREFAEAMEIYASAFPQSERHAVEVISQRVTQGLNELYLGRLKNEVIFMALLWPLNNTEFILLDYMATVESHRNKGVGTNFMQVMKEVLVHNRKHLIMEVENVEHGSNKEQRRRRISFYKRVGAKEMKNVRYVLPGLDGGDPTEMTLMIFPDYPTGIVDGNMIQNLISQIYYELYSRDKDDLLLNSFINTIGDQIELI